MPGELGGLNPAFLPIIWPFVLCRGFARIPVLSGGGEQGISFDDSRIHIRFENVSFKYPQSEQYALRNVSFEILPGEKAALIGVNGAGKSTLVKLLLGIFEPTEGTIYINGIDLKDLDKRTWRNAVGVDVPGLRQISVPCCG